MVKRYNQVDIQLAVTPIAGYRKNRTTLVVFNTDAVNTIYLGDDEVVTAVDGFPLLPGAWWAFSPESGDDPRLALYALAVGGVVDVRWWEDSAPAVVV